MTAKKQIDVVGAVIVADGHILCARRGPSGPIGGLWEFPGGKVELGEDPRAALAREIAEELECEIEVGDHVETTTHHYDFAIIVLTTFYCRITAGSPVLTEHAETVWLRPRELKSLEWAPADIPAVEKLEREADQRG